MTIYMQTQDIGSKKATSIILLRKFIGVSALTQRLTTCWLIGGAMKSKIGLFTYILARQHIKSITILIRLGPTLRNMCGKSL